MEAVLIEAQSKEDVKFWLDLARKTGARARSLNAGTIEDKILAEMIEEGMKTRNVSRKRVMEALGK